MGNGGGVGHVDHQELGPIQRCHVHGCVDDLDVLVEHCRVTSIPGLEDPRDDVEKQTVLGRSGANGGTTSGMPNKFGDAELLDDQPFIVDHPVFSSIIEDLTALRGQSDNASKMLNGEFYRRALDHGVKDISFTSKEKQESIKIRYSRKKSKH
ncbi:unnamed protein product [Cuscuta campestris]|uniref:Uncharacterized protein n=1 Tax=Cuscuta campestris TaxID=132261 RepID=A0A484LDK2_9ASTE|nr:unnamed protein product [Cuscuta campestris]